jgi:hypothetical protein
LERLATVKYSGYVSLVLTGSLFVMPSIEKWTAGFDMAAGSAILILAVWFADRGIRSGTGGGRVAAWGSVIVLAVTVIVTAVVICVTAIAEIDWHH